MRFIFTSYSSSPDYDHPAIWLKRIEGYTGILECLGKQHTVIGIERINYEGEYTQNGVQYYFVNLKKKTVYFPRRLHRLVKELQPDIVFVNGFIFPLQILQLKLKLGKAVKIIVLHRAEKPFTGIKRYLQKLANHYVDAYLFTSLEFGNIWKGTISLGKIQEVIQASSVFTTMDQSTARQQTNMTGDPAFLWVGRLDANKDPLTVLKAFLQFVQQQPAARLYMIYQAEDLLKEVKDLVGSKRNGSEAVYLAGKVSHPQMQDWYNSADFIISGSHYEGSGVAVCEAMSCGCIPVLTAIPSFKRMTGPGKCGLLYEAGNGNALLAALLQTSSMNREKEKDKTIKQFREELSFEAIARKINTIVASL